MELIIIERTNSEEPYIEVQSLDSDVSVFLYDTTIDEAKRMASDRGHTVVTVVLD